MKSILCFGDSNTYGYRPGVGGRYDKNTRWTGRLSKLLGEEYHVIEEGSNGRTSAFADPYDPWNRGLDYLKPCLNTHKPVDCVILMLGSNDLKKQIGVSAKQIAEGVGTLVETIRQFAMEKQGYIPKIILVSPICVLEGIEQGPFGDEFEQDAVTRSREFSEYYRQVAAAYDCIFVDAAEIAEASELDCLHLSEEGHALLASEFAGVIRENL